MLIFFSLSALVNAITSTIVAILVISRSAKSQLNQSFFLFAISVSFWSYAYFFWQISGSEQSALFWCRALMFGAIFIPPTFLHFSTNLIGKFSKYKNQVIFWYIISFIFVIINTTQFFVIKVEKRLFFDFWPVPGVLYSPFLVMFIVLTVYSHILIYRTYNELSGTAKNQIKYVFLGTAIGFIGGVTNYLLWYNIPFPPIGNILVSVYVFLIAYSIIKYRLMDIKLVLTRAGIFIIVYTLVLGFPFWFGVNLIGWGKWLIPLSLMAFLATLGPFIYLFIQKRAENRLLSEQRRYQATLRQASAGMGRIKDLSKLLNMIVYVLTRAVRIDHALVYIKSVSADSYILAATKRRKGSLVFPVEILSTSPIIDYFKNNSLPLILDEIEQSSHSERNDRYLEVEKFMIKLHCAVIFPIFIERNLIAVVVMGNKESGKLYTEDDLSVFSILANQAALAIENAQFYEDMKKTQEQLFQAEKMATIGTMADGLSHQINNRFHALGFIASDAIDTIQINRNVEMSDKVKEVIGELENALKRVQENVVQGGEIVQGLLRYTRKGDTAFTAVDIDAVLKSAIEMTQFKIKTHELKILRNYDVATMPKVKGNFTQLQEVFFNLIDNGYDAMMQRKSELKEPGFQPTLKVSVESVDNKVLITVEDNGIGVKEEDVQKLFTPFFTTKLSSKKGTGLGLYVIKKIIEDNHLGRVEFASKYMSGTQMKLYLPPAVI